MYVEDLTVTRRRVANETRNVAIYLVRHYTVGTLERIGREFNMNILIQLKSKFF